MMENIYDEYLILKIKNEQLSKENEELKNYVKALEANTPKSVLRRLDIQLDRNKYEKE